MERSFFDYFFREFFNEEDFFTKKLNSKNTKNKEENSDYQKSEHEEISKDGKTKRVSIVETWTDENGITNKLTSIKTVPNISEKELKNQDKIKKIKEEIKTAVKNEDYESAAKLKKELEKIGE